VLGSYVAYFAYVQFGIHPFISIVIAGVLLYALGYAVQAGIINRVLAAPVLITLTLTFGLDLMLNDAMLVAFTADYRRRKNHPHKPDFGRFIRRRRDACASTVTTSRIGGLTRSRGSVSRERSRSCSRFPR
jgi:branched-subunit amino acid ABC-type transport system permease component